MAYKLYVSEDAKVFKQVSEVSLTSNSFIPKTYVYAAIGSYIQKYTDSKESKYTKNNERTYFSKFYEFLLSKEIYSLDQITHDTIVDYRNELAKRVSASTINRQFSTFNHFFSLLFKTEKISKDPCLFIKDLKEEEPRIHLWTFADFRRCFRDVPVRAQQILMFLILTGARVCEAINLKWSDIDFDQGLVYLRSKKNSKKARSIELTTAVDRWLHRIPMNGTYVFGQGSPYTNYGLLQSVQRGVKRVCKNKKLDVKGIRHSFCTNQFVKNIPSAVIQRQMGHASLKTTERYKHLARKHVQKFIK